MTATQKPDGWYQTADLIEARTRHLRRCWGRADELDAMPADLFQAWEAEQLENAARQGFQVERNPRDRAYRVTDTFTGRPALGSYDRYSVTAFDLEYILDLARLDPIEIDAEPADADGYVDIRCATLGCDALIGYCHPPRPAIPELCDACR